MASRGLIAAQIGHCDIYYGTGCRQSRKVARNRRRRIRASSDNRPGVIVWRIGDSDNTCRILKKLSVRNDATPIAYRRQHGNVRRFCVVCLVKRSHQYDLWPENSGTGRVFKVIWDAIAVSVERKAIGARRHIMIANVYNRISLHGLIRLCREMI